MPTECFAVMTALLASFLTSSLPQSPPKSIIYSLVEKFSHIKEKYHFEASSSSSSSSSIHFWFCLILSLNVRCVLLCLRTLMPNDSETGNLLGLDIHTKMGPIFMGCFIVDVAV